MRNRQEPENQTRLPADLIALIMPAMETPVPAVPGKRKWITVALLVAGLAVLLTWLLLTPAGLDGKMHAAGYSVCHQIESHTLSIGGKLLPLCARCTGTFLGLLITLVTLSRRGKKTGVPSRPIFALLILFFLAFLADGINSTLTILPGLQPLYPPNNILRLATGLLFGISLGTLALTLWNQTLWADGNPEALLSNWQQVLVLVAMVAVTGILILANITWLYYPVAILSTAAIFLILSMIYTLLWCIILKKENTLHHFKDGIRIYNAGVITAVVQVGLMDLLRFLLTHTWNSF